MEQEPSLWAQILGRAAYEFTQIQPMLPTYAHLIVSALFPIYAGAHASLARPSSAAKPTKKKRKSGDGDEDESSDEEEEEEHKMEGLAPTDAIVMPLFAGITLAGLYFLIQWLQDPALLNKLLNGYFALFGVFSVSRLVTDTLDIGHSIIFPHRYALGGALYYVDGKRKEAVPVAHNTKDKTAIRSPLPGLLAKLPLSEGLRNMLWADRAMPGNKWTLRLYLHRAFAGKVLIGPHGMVGATVAVLAVAYFNLVDKPWYLTNLMGFGFSYGALQLMSPTTFATGSLILGALFFYDIYFVFYT
jgi:minor histocompatibility antigen H13